MTLSEAQAHLANATAAYAAAQKAYSTTFGDRTVVNQRLDHARDDLMFWERKVAELTAQAAGSSRGGVVIATWR